MEYRFEEIKDACVLHIKGSLLSYLHQNEIVEAVIEKIEFEDQRDFIINLSGMEKMNSTGLGTLLTILNKARIVGGEVVLCCVPEHLSNLLIITKLNSIFLIKASVEEAFNCLKEGVHT